MPKQVRHDSSICRNGKSERHPEFISGSFSDFPFRFYSPKPVLQLIFHNPIRDFVGVPVYIL